MGCHFLLQGIFLRQGSNPYLLHWQVHSLPLSHLGSLYGIGVFPIKTKAYISGPTQLKLVLFKGQLYFRLTELEPLGKGPSSLWFNSPPSDPDSCLNFITIVSNDVIISGHRAWNLIGNWEFLDHFQIEDIVICLSGDLEEVLKWKLMFGDHEQSLSTSLGQLNLL